MKLLPLMLTVVLGPLAAVSQAAANEPPSKPGKPKSFAELDSDGSGYLTEDEVSDDRFLAEQFSRLDSNNDGTLTEDELKAPGQPGDADGHQPPSFAELDTDGDGVISLSEAASDHFLSEMFDKMDRDGSGSLSEDEMRPPQR